MSQRPLPLRFTIDGRAVRASTVVADKGPPWVATITTSLPALGLEVSSTYVGRQGTDTHIVHVLLAPGETRTCTEDREAGTLPLTHAREHLLYDHLAALQAHVGEHGGILAADVDDRTTAAVALTV